MRVNSPFLPRAATEFFALFASALNPTVESRQAKEQSLGVLERLDHWLSQSRQRELDAHLARATDIYDLEARLRALERGEAWRGFPEH